MIFKRFKMIQKKSLQLLLISLSLVISIFSFQNCADSLDGVKGNQLNSILSDLDVDERILKNGISFIYFPSNQGVDVGFTQSVDLTPNLEYFEKFTYQWVDASQPEVIIGTDLALQITSQLNEAQRGSDLVGDYKLKVFFKGKNIKEQTAVIIKNEIYAQDYDLVSGGKSTKNCLSEGGEIVIKSDVFCKFELPICPNGWAQFKGWSSTSNSGVSTKIYWDTIMRDTCADGCDECVYFPDNKYKTSYQNLFKHTCGVPAAHGFSDNFGIEVNNCTGEDKARYLSCPPTPVQVSTKRSAVGCTGI